MAVAQGIYKKLAYKKQSALGTAASGGSGQYLRRESATFNFKKDTFSADEIVSHQQDTGDTYGVGKVDGTVNGVLSGATYKDFMQSVCRRDFATVTAITAASFTIAGAGPYTITRAAGSFLSDGIKIGHVVRITAGTYTGTARDINLIVTGVVALVLTVIVANGSTLSAQGPIASSTLTVMGKTTIAPSTSHTNDYYTIEEWFSDLSRSRTYTDVQVASIDVSIPASGNASVNLAFLGIGRTKGSSQVLTSPTAETTSTILTSSNAKILIAGSTVVTGTSLSLKIDGQMQHGEANIGSSTVTDIVKSDIKVTGSFMAVHDAETTSDLFVNETALSVMAFLFADSTATSEFIAFVIPRAKLFGDDLDDGKKQLVASYPFVAEYNSAGGAALANDQTIIGLQDSLA